MVRALRTIDLFAGCGGMSAGFARHGFSPTLAVEQDLSAAATYAANHGERHVWWGDIGAIPDDEIPDADVIIGGPPCQGFSNLGSRDKRDPRNKLWRQYLRFVSVARPLVFVIENVGRFRTSPEFALLHKEASNGLIEGYELSDGLLIAADFGVPQRRVRTILIGSRIGRIPLPEPTYSREGATRPRWRTVRDAIDGLPLLPDTTELPASNVEYFGQTVPGIFKGLDLHVGRQPTPKSLQRYDYIPPGGGRLDLPPHLLPECWRNKASGTTDVMGRMQWDHPSLTIRTEFFKPEKGQYLHPQWEPRNRAPRANRVITHYEAALLQSFPSDYLWCGSKVDIARQIGNAVPVDLAAAVARQVALSIRRAQRH